MVNKLSIYGPKLWFILHSLAYKFIPQNKACFLTFIYSIQELIPCIRCRTHFQENLKDFPPDDFYLNSHLGLFIWSYLMHERVNKQLNKNGIAFNVASEFYSVASNNTNQLGANLWHIIHTFASGYEGRPSQKTCFVLFIECLCRLTPWNISFWVKQLPLTADRFFNKESLLTWTYLLHDMVNKHMGKDSPSFTVVKNFYIGNEECKACNINS